MRLFVNGMPQSFPADAKLEDVVESEGIPAKHVVVEVNGRFVPRKQHQETSLSEGDRVEIILPAFGG